MQLLTERLHATLVSVGHRPELEAFHERKLVLEAHAGEARLVRDEDLPSPERKHFRWRWRHRSRGEDVDSLSGAH